MISRDIWEGKFRFEFGDRQMAGTDRDLSVHDRYLVFDNWLWDNKL
jgi:hypothetical protein